MALRWALGSLFAALFAGIAGFTGMVASVASGARILFFLCLLLFFSVLLGHLARRPLKAEEPEVQDSQGSIHKLAVQNRKRGSTHESIENNLTGTVAVRFSSDGNSASGGH